MTNEQKVYIIEHRLKLRSSKIAKNIGVSKAVVTEYMRIHEISPDKKIINAWRSESRKASAAKKKSQKSENTFDGMILFAKELGYNNTQEAIGELGARGFKNKYKQSFHKENSK